MREVVGMAVLDDDRESAIIVCAGRSTVVVEWPFPMLVGVGGRYVDEYCKDGWADVYWVDGGIDNGGECAGFDARPTGGLDVAVDIDDDTDVGLWWLSVRGY